MKQRLKIIATADVHGRFCAEDFIRNGKYKYGALSRVAKYVRELRERGEAVILLDVGDIIHGNYSEVAQSVCSGDLAALLNYMGYDAVALGNHEFNHGRDYIENFREQFDGRIVCANVLNESGECFVDDSVSIDCNGTKVAVIGAVTPMIKQFESGSDNLKGLSVISPEAAFEKIDVSDVDLVFGLFHMGPERENEVEHTSGMELLENVKIFDAAMLAHVHNVLQPSYEAKPVAMVGKGAERIAVFEVVKEEEKTYVERAYLEHINDDISEDDGALALLEQYCAFIREYAGEQIGELSGIGDMKRVDTRIHNSVVSELLCRVFMYYSDADVCAFHVGDRDVLLSDGAFLRRDVARIYPYANGEISVYEIGYDDLLTYMEWSAAYFDGVGLDGNVIENEKRSSEKYSTYDFFGGIKYKINLGEPVGSRVEISPEDVQRLRRMDRIRLAMNGYRMKRLCSSGGIFEGRGFAPIYSTKSLEHGKIVNLIEDYIIKVCKGKVVFL